MFDMSDRGPILVKSALEEDGEDLEGVRVDILSLAPQRTLSIPISEEILSQITENTTELQEKLNKFVNGVNVKIQSVDNLSIERADKVDGTDDDDGPESSDAVIEDGR
jgi:hypothetical protein